jgi:hypothetical protein
MYWSFEHKGQSYISWSSPRLFKEDEVTNLMPRFDIGIYNGKSISPGETVGFFTQGDSALRLGDSMWFISYIRDVYRLKSRRRARMIVCSSPWIQKFYRNFLPKSFEYVNEYMTEKDFMKLHHKLPSMSYWKSPDDRADRSWVDNKSILERLYHWAGMEYEGLPDWGEFTNEEFLYPSNDFWKEYGLNKNDRYVYFQWHSSSQTKNLPEKANIRLIKHVTNKYQLKVYVIGHWQNLDMLSEIPGVVNLSGKTKGTPEVLFTLAFNSEFIVCPDSVGTHLSEAYHIPAVTIMSALPPVYVANKYKIPCFMFGSGFCPYAPCGIIGKLPKKTKCPVGTDDYCKVFDEIDLDLFDRCLEKSFMNVRQYRNRRIKEDIDFYSVKKPPISLTM